ncbi:hypothetical protein VP01_1801g3 [Puccinia sorghi]|uniref:Prolyl 4-hydroxylase alpha subunit Fe(2+) 2OG dioxygenase domain-containing protein n=1 Tax=Puccinia sorghi TaxID=27349 RepID=A0A0L6VG53_9BASI|nr:hypothetical protein VP01_1801g3 [Puccinia sorghi]
MAHCGACRGPLPNLHVSLLRAFDTINTPGTFAASKALPETPPAGLHVNGVGDILLPLSKEQTQQLIEKAQQAGVSIGEQKKLDNLPIPNTWEFNADQLRFFDPAWQGYLLDLGKRAACKLGIQAPIRLELFKMDIYAKGVMTKPQTETERTRGMFGTLIISLPSAHKGGEVVVRHNGEAITLLTEKQSFACWYSDATHELLQVISGYRCVLTYNLAAAPGATWPTARALDLKKARETLEYWLHDLATNNAAGPAIFTSALSMNTLNSPFPSRCSRLKT